MTPLGVILIYRALLSYTSVNNKRIGINLFQTIKTNNYYLYVLQNHL